MERSKVPYEVALRGIGAYFDEHGAQQVSVIETVTGFSIRYHFGTAEAELRSAEFKHDDLESLTGHLEWYRNPSHSDRPANHKDHYQDFFRALGHELDYVTAYDILLDDAGDAILLTYLKLDPAHSVAARKVMILVGPSEQRDVLENAHRRRKSGSNQPRSLGALEAQPQMHGSHELDTRTTAPTGEVKPGDAPWEIGERELYSTVLKNASTGSQERGACDVVLTNRRIVLRFRDGDLLRIRLTETADVATNVSREILTKHYRIEVSLTGGDLLTLDCQSAEQMNEILGMIGTGRSESPI
jgi:hypothetical protein